MTNCETTTRLRRGVKRIAPVFLAIAVGWVGSAARAQGQPSGPGTGSGGQIESSWILSASTPTGTFSSLASFASGGVFTGTGSNDRINPVSELHGSWDRISGRQRFGVTVFFFGFDPANPNGPAIVMLKSNMAVQLRGEGELVGIGDLNACDSQGRNCVAVPGYLQLTGRRIVPENVTALVPLLPPE